MNLLTTEQITWTVPVPQWARKLLRELDGLKQEEGADADKRRSELLAKLPKSTRYRLTFKSVTVYDENLRDALLRDMRAWFEEKYGISLGDFVTWYFDTYARKIESEIAYERGQGMSLVDARDIFGEAQDIGNWATINVCLVKIEQAEIAMGNGDGHVTWHDADIPAAWRSYQDFIAEVPRPLFEACVQVCNDLNPGVWRIEMDEEAKNFGGVSVTR